MNRKFGSIFGAITAFSVLAACSSGQPRAQVSAQAEDAVTYVTDASTSELDNVNWYTFYRPVLSLSAATYNDYPEQMVNANICESVVRQDWDYSVTSGLADFEQVDETTYRYTLREGAAFWDGTPVTPEDVIFSIGRNTSAPWGGRNGDLAAIIKSMEADGDKTVVITLTRPDITFNMRLAGSSGKVYQKAQAESVGDDWGNPQGGVMCTGPFKMGKWDPSNSLQIVRNDDYWSDDFKPKVKSVTFLYPQDPATLSNSFRNGSLDGGFLLPASILGQLQQSDAGSVVIGSKSTALQNFSLAIGNVTSGNIADPKIRQAFWASIDREGIAKTIYAGAADPLYALSPPGTYLYGADELAAADAKLAKTATIDHAKALLAESSNPNPTITIGYGAGSPFYTQVLTAIQTSAAAAGIKVELKPLPSAQYGALFTDPTAREGIDAWITTGFPPARDPLINYQRVMGTGGGQNFNSLSDPEVDAKLAAAAGSSDEKARTQAVLELEGMFAEQVTSFPILSPRVTLWQGSKLTGAPTTLAFLHSPWAALLGGK